MLLPTDILHDVRPEQSNKTSKSAKLTTSHIIKPPMKQKQLLLNSH